MVLDFYDNNSDKSVLPALHSLRFWPITELVIKCLSLFSFHLPMHAAVRGSSTVLGSDLPAITASLTFAPADYSASHYLDQFSRIALQQADDQILLTSSIAFAFSFHSWHWSFISLSELLLIASEPPPSIIYHYILHLFITHGATSIISFCICWMVSLFPLYP